MVTPQSPTPMFNGLDDDLYNDAKFAHEINDKMRVPKRIKATGEFSDEDHLLSNQNGLMNSWNYHDKIDMNVPDRIVVLGHNQHLETRSAPREIQLENSILPKNPSMGFMRVQTPPRVITLTDHHFPSASEDSTPLHPNGNLYRHDDDDEDDEQNATQYVRSNGNIRMGFHNGNDANSVESDSQLTTGSASKRSQLLQQQQSNLDGSMLAHREGTPMGELTPHEEILYLRRQLAKLNRRVLNIEINNEQRMQREKIVYCLGLAYFVLKTIFWLNRSN
ncbi:transport and Golgi organization protein 11 isoform X1 [Drosophila nasuta]|uniref:Transport and Golgi organization protein 11 isoform X1 n=1 Tax=Drosophila albomicans TaxID=7291 RepID=A0A6P8Y0M2_DROAB|nr:transport and Golgi organization protein 11 isoform X1 [Drosophila albomicans]XP_034102698.1 transport and Golgi organization protein 11 isoform X1 [Drosophila albomicans]XP_060660467.1 transport and Golgi organization protein 11 isoform X1 [Drosophila nasuta]